MRNDGGPAFPQTEIDGMPLHHLSELGYGGMSLLDYFAGQAMVAYFSSAQAQEQLAFAMQQQEVKTGTPEYTTTMNRVMAKRAYMLAEAMLAERQKRATAAAVSQAREQAAPRKSEDEVAPLDTQVGIEFGIFNPADSGNDEAHP